MVAIETDERIGALGLGELIVRLERASGRPVDVVLIGEASSRKL